MKMRIKILVLLIPLLLPDLAKAQLISHLPMDNSSLDMVGKNHAQLFNAQFTDGAAIGGQALAFGDRQAHRSAWLGDPELPEDGFSISIWINPDPETAGHQTLVSKRNAWSAEGLHWQFLYGAPRTEEQLENEDYDYFRFESYDSRVEFKYQLNPGEWTHLTITYDGRSQTVRLYINGLAHQDSGQKVELGDAKDAHLVLGGPHPSDWPEIFNGKIDDVAIWQHILSDGEIQFLYDLGSDSRFRLDAGTVARLIGICNEGASREYTVGSWRWKCQPHQAGEAPNESIQFILDDAILTASGL